MPTQVMLVGSTSYEEVRVIDAIIDEMECGIFINSARLVDQVLRDARVFSTLMTRIMGLLGKPREFEAAEPSDGRNKSTATKAVDVLKADFDVMVEHSQLVELMVWGLMHNSGIAQIIEDSDPWRIEVWHPWALNWDEYQRKYWLRTREDARIYLEQDGRGGFVDDETRTRWVLFTPHGYGNVRRNYLRAMHRLTNERQWSHRDRARFSEVFGLPTWLGIAPGDSTKEERSEYKKRLGPKGAESVVVAAQGVEGNKWGLELVQANSAGAEKFFNGTLTQLDKEIATLLLGQSQTTDGQAGLGANEMAGEPVRLDVMSADNQAVGSSLRTQFFMPYWEFAYGKAELAPKVCWRIVPPEDGAKKTLEFQQLMEGIATAIDKGIPLDVRAILEDNGVPMISVEEQKAMEAAKQKAAADTLASQNSDPNADPAQNDSTKGAKKETPPALPAQK